jgi:hypothetical protein
LLATRKDLYAIPQEDMELLILEIFTDYSPSLMSLNVSPLVEGEESEEWTPSRDYRQDFMLSMARYGLLDAGAASRILGIPLQEVDPLEEVPEIIGEMSDFGDEEAGIEGALGRMAEWNGNQGVIVTGVLEVPLVP